MDKAVRGTPKKRMCEENRRTCPVFGNGIRDRGERQFTLVRNRMRLYETFRQKFAPEAVKIAFESSIRLQEPGDELLWKCRSPPKWKR
jgi:hypothetical protein